MGYMTDGLTFNTLRQGNRLRLPEFKNERGALAHEKPDGSDWKLSAWSNAVGGELGEMAEALIAFGHVANRIKKIERGDMLLEQVRSALADEIADIVIYLDLLAYRAEIDLGQATMAKWNRKSREIGSAWVIEPDGCHRRL